MIFRKNLTLFFFFVCSFFVFIYILFFSPIFVVKDVQCSQKHSVCDTLQTELQGENIFLLDSNVIEKNWIEEYATIDNVFIHKRLPSFITLEIIQQESLYILVFDNEYLVINKDGNVVSTAQQADIPEIFIEVNKDTILIKDRVEDDMHNFFSTFIQSIEDSHLIYSALIFKGTNEIRVQLRGVAEAIMKTENIESQVYALQYMLSHSTIEKQYRTIDMRFEKPILRNSIDFIKEDTL